MVYRVQNIIDEHGTKITKQRQQMEENKIIEEMNQCTFTPRINKTHNYKSNNKTPRHNVDD